MRFIKTQLRDSHLGPLFPERSKDSCPGQSSALRRRDRLRVCFMRSDKIQEFGSYPRRPPSFHQGGAVVEARRVDRMWVVMLMTQLII
jgi:hypothetical protein